MRVPFIYSLSFILLVLPAALFAAESLDKRLFAELRTINELRGKLVSADGEFIGELERERCLKASSPGAAPMSQACKEQSLRHLKALDENNRKSEGYVRKMVEGWARVYGMLRVAHMQCGLNSMNFEAVPASLRAQAAVIMKDSDALVLEYIEASESALKEDLDALDCDAIQSFTATVQQIMIAAQRAMEKMR
ncbi:hypothetical protein [Marinobacter sp. BGYM27]|uniref:hypothetical protein n=1 Tax=Marinobacter sp. BGYM27 TaxID=2975597 RepID=UPI0021A6FCAE|nr:hypothetical protein [Marinobacter sp. BGYM27]MDG5499753.1 hypothetical protein [Marinobacter sp. BGYM27]